MVLCYYTYSEPKVTIYFQMAVTRRTRMMRTRTRRTMDLKSMTQLSGWDPWQVRGSVT